MRELILLRRARALMKSNDIVMIRVSLRFLGYSISGLFDLAKRNSLCVLLLNWNGTNTFII